MTDGLVSNCWSYQFEHGDSIFDLVAEAQRRGMSYVELRQHSLGQLEEDGMPRPAEFRKLASQFPDVEFNLAIAVPFLNPTAEISATTLFETSVAACCELAINHPPHLRLVDLETTLDQSQTLEAEVCGPAISRLATILHRSGGLLSVEHSIQLWTLFYGSFKTARASLLGQGVPQVALKICFDPCNLLLTGEDLDVPHVTGNLSRTELSMIHFKQRSHGTMSATVSDGEINWPIVCEKIVEQELTVPRLLEIPGAADIWENIKTSNDYLASC